MKKLIFYSILGLLLASCTSSEPEPDPDPIPEEQEIVYVDTSGLTGRLTVVAKYYTSSGQLMNAPTGSLVSLYASYDDLVNGLSLYNVATRNDTAYFGYINYGNYYVLADTYVDTSYYYGEAAVQIRPDREETLTITMY